MEDNSVDWSVPVNGAIDVPDELMPLFNKIAFQFKFVQISGKDEGDNTNL